MKRFFLLLSAGLMAVNHLEATLRVCYGPTSTFAHKLLVIWPVACLAWLPCTEHQSCEHLSHEGNSVAPLEVINGSQSPGSNISCLLLPYKDLCARTICNGADPSPSNVETLDLLGKSGFRKAL